MTDWIARCKELADALEVLLSGNPDMPTYGADIEEADDLLESTRRALEEHAAKQPREGTS